MRGIQGQYSLKDELARLRSHAARDQGQGPHSSTTARSPSASTSSSRWTASAQTLHVHLEEYAPGGRTQKHGHVNEAAFYILDGEGYEIHDGVRYDWKAGDVAIVHMNCVHQHFNASTEKPARALVLKPKPMHHVHEHAVPADRDPAPEGGRVPGGRGLQAAQPRNQPQPRRMKNAHRLGRLREEVRHREGNALYALGARRGARHHQLVLRREPAHGRAQALGAARRQGRLPQPRRLAHLERLLRVRDPAGQEPRAAAPAVRGDDLRARRPRLDHGVERRRQAHRIRVEGGRDLRHPAQLPRTSTSTARARSRRASSPSPTRR